MKIILFVVATWCAPCHTVGPMVDRWAARHPEVQIQRMDWDQQREILRQYHLEGVPALIDNGRIYSPDVIYQWAPDYIEDWYNN